jgi:hypothetical protein
MKKILLLLTIALSVQYVYFKAFNDRFLDFENYDGKLFVLSITKNNDYNMYIFDLNLNLITVKKLNIPFNLILAIYPVSDRKFVYVVKENNKCKIVLYDLIYGKLQEKITKYPCEKVIVKDYLYVVTYSEDNYLYLYKYYYKDNKLQSDEVLILTPPLKDIYYISEEIYYGDYGETKKIYKKLQSIDLPTYAKEFYPGDGFYVFVSKYGKLVKDKNVICNNFETKGYECKGYCILIGYCKNTPKLYVIHREVKSETIEIPSEFEIEKAKVINNAVYLLLTSRKQSAIGFLTPSKVEYYESEKIVLNKFLVSISITIENLINILLNTIFLPFKIIFDIIF